MRELVLVSEGWGLLSNGQWIELTGGEVCVRDVEET